MTRDAWTRRDGSHALTEAERAQLLAVANEPRFAAAPPARIVPMLADEGEPARIVPMLADEGVYLASESSFRRVLKAHGQSAHRGRAKAPKRPGLPPHTSPPKRVRCGAGT